MLKIKSSQKLVWKIKTLINATTTILAIVNSEIIADINTTQRFVLKAFARINNAGFDILEHASMEMIASFMNKTIVSSVINQTKI